MLRTIPSQVVEAIDDFCPNLKISPEIRFGGDQANEIAGILQMIGVIPQELLLLEASQLRDFAMGTAGLQHMLEIWRAQGSGVSPPQRARGVHPLYLIRTVLKDCPDARPAPSTAELSFIGDAKLRESIRQDISSANTSLQYGDWKAATVLAGAAIEALLLWLLQNRVPSQQVAAATLTLARKPQGTDLERWTLVDYIDVCEALHLIVTDTATQCRLAKDFRNLIHPGRAARQQKACNRATALSALAGVDHVVADI